jgi:oligo-1,6-glucosidase
MLGLMEFTLRGTPFVYQGQEIGMTNFDFTGLAQVNDVESHGLDTLMKKLHIPGFLRWRWIKASSRDNARTPMQWSARKNAGFTGGRPWLGINSNYTRINYESQKDDPGSVLQFYKKMIRLRSAKECLKRGDFVPLHGGARLMAYRRSLEGESYTVLLNFSGREVTLPAALRSGGRLLVSTAGRAEIDDRLLPWEGALIAG